MDVSTDCFESEFAPIPLLSRLMWISTGSIIPDPSCPRAPPFQPIFFNRIFPLLSSGNGLLSPSIYIKVHYQKEQECSLMWLCLLVFSGKLAQDVSVSFSLQLPWYYVVFNLHIFCTPTTNSAAWTRWWKAIPLPFRCSSAGRTSHNRRLSIGNTVLENYLHPSILSACWDWNERKGLNELIVDQKFENTHNALILRFGKH